MFEPILNAENDDVRLMSSETGYPNCCPLSNNAQQNHDAKEGIKRQ